MVKSSEKIERTSNTKEERQNKNKKKKHTKTGDLKLGSGDKKANER